MESYEIDEGKKYIGFQDALDQVHSKVFPSGIEELDLSLCVGRIVAEDLIARVDNPSSDVSLKDGFAVRSEDVAQASLQRPVRLRVIGSVFAGSQFKDIVSPYCAVRICSGSPVPAGADAVVSDEFCEEASSEVYVTAVAEAGRNVLNAAEDIKAGTVIVEKGQLLLPGCLGLVAAAGISKVKVYRRPKVAIVAVGDEVVAPGRRLQAGQLYASNLVTIGAWLAAFGIPYDTSVVGDNEDVIRQELLRWLPDADAILTSGGAWGSERDLVVRTLDELSWDKLFHHVRMGPGKPIAFGLLKGKPVFCLPGGPASNEMAFLQLALPSLMRMAGLGKHVLQTVSARLTQDVQSRNKEWAEFKRATLSYDSEGNYTVMPYQSKSRLQSIADSACLLCIPEGVETLKTGEVVSVQILVPTFGGFSVAR